ncbi:glycoside hydrolase family 71 protein [Zalerion maritima]|uniref:Glycoside hydrolase family 71 protein n=1 Tax=Zalerion maritima TaxID=339359 RepID=A0AAD5WQP9_9PEZI|nr:glycoside hydrolase family 71 protein [Zalerion maritima]
MWPSSWAALLLLCLTHITLGRPSAPSKMQRRDDSDRKVFAHYMVGLTSGQTASKWALDISEAQTASIDGFALNCGPADSWTYDQLTLAYAAASEAGFLLFISFDFAAGDWDVSSVAGTISTYKDSSAQWTQDGRPVVSTFEGPSWVDNWTTVRGQVDGGIWLIPDWSSLGAAGVGNVQGSIDGAFNWESWPLAGQTSKNTDADVGYVNALGSDKKYMMGVSPYFFTDLPAYGKNWYSSSETLWYDRWMQVFDIMPDFIQIISWNDFGESHYISDIEDSQIVSGAEWYVQNHPHAAFRLTLPYFIAAYKAGTKDITPPTGDVAIAWYKTVAVGDRAAGGAVWGQGGTEPAYSGASDVVSVLAITGSSGVVALQLGDTKHSVDVAGPVAFFTAGMPAGGGQVILSLNGEPAEGPAIGTALSSSDSVDFNSVVISVP